MVEGRSFLRGLNYIGELRKRNCLENGGNGGELLGRGGGDEKSPLVDWESPCRRLNADTATNDLTASKLISNN